MEEDSLLVQLLKAGLLGELATDDDRLGYAVEAAARVSKFLGGEGARSVPAALHAALDEHGNGEVEILGVAAEELLDLWPMMTNAFDGGRPTELLRAVLVQAVFDAAGSSNDIAIAVWMLTRNIADLDVPVGSWKSVLDPAIRGLGDQVVQMLDAKWSDSGGGTSQLKMPQIETPAGVELAFAALESFESEAANLQPNQMHPVVGTHLPGILAEIRSQILAVAEAGNKANAGQLVALRDELGRRLRTALKAQTQVLETARLQQRMLWWRLSGHSDVAESRYDEIDNQAERVVSAVLDLTRIAPGETPLAVEHLLIDMLASAGTSERLVVGELNLFADRFGESSGAMQPFLLVEAIRGGESTQGPAGVDEIPWELAAKVLFRELQAERLLDKVVPASENT